MLYTICLAGAMIISAAALPALAQPASPNPSQAWPMKPIRVLVGAPAGGTSDILTRMLGTKLTALGSRPHTKTPQDMGKWIAGEKERWGQGDQRQRLEG